VGPPYIHTYRYIAVYSEQLSGPLGMYAARPTRPTYPRNSMAMYTYGNICPYEIHSRTHTYTDTYICQHTYVNTLTGSHHLCHTHIYRHITYGNIDLYDIHSTAVYTYGNLCPYEIHSRTMCAARPTHTYVNTYRHI